MKELFQALSWYVVCESQMEDEARTARSNGRPFLPVLDDADRQQYVRELRQAAEARGVLYQQMRGFNISIHPGGLILATPMGRWATFLNRLAGLSRETNLPRH